jgi:hypothetical protein
MRNALLTVHVVASVGLVGADLALLALGIAGTGVARAASLVASGVVAPLIIAALVTGVALVARSGPGLLRYWWVTIKLATTLVFTSIVLGVLVPRLADAAETAPAGGEGQLSLVLVPALATAVLIGLAALGITKPRWRWGVRSDRPARAASITR